MAVPRTPQGGGMNVLYLSYTGLLEPLGQSQVLAYLRVLAREHRITLVSFEKAADLTDATAVKTQRDACAALGIRWIAKRYHKTPRLLATAWDMTTFLATAVWETRRADLIHARSYLPAFVAMTAGALANRPFIFDMRALWPEEMVAAGRLKADSTMYRLLKRMEIVCLRRAAAIVSLTRAATPYIKARLDASKPVKPIVVIPTCADLERFTPRLGESSHALRSVGSVGTVLSGWFRFDWLKAFLIAAVAAQPDLDCAVVTREREDAVRASLGDGQNKVRIYGVPPADVPDAVRSFDAVAMFFTDGGLAKLGSCPTRMGEVLGCGLPLVSNGGIGDVADVIARHRVGVLVREGTQEAMARAVVELKALLSEPDLQARCRAAAEAEFSLTKGAAAYDTLYHAIGPRQD